MKKSAVAPLSNTALQGKARRINAFMRAYVNLHYGYIQESTPDWRARSAGYLTNVAALVAELRALDSRTGELDENLVNSAYGRSRCLETAGEPVLVSRIRGHACEAAGDLAEALRRGDITTARNLFQELYEYMDRLS